MSSDQLREFFANLRDRSITVCENCADTAVLAVHREKSDLGYCFYRPEDLFYASETGILRLRWGSYSMDQMAMLVIVNAILDEAKACHLNVSWAGSIHDRIILQHLDTGYFLEKCSV